MACLFGQEEAVKTLLGHKTIMPALADHYGATPVDAAVRNGHPRILEILLEARCTLNDTNNYMGTSLVGWARLCSREGYDSAESVRILRTEAERTELQLRDDAPPTGYSWITDETDKGWCDACSLFFQRDTIFHRCTICCGGDYLAICEPCWNRDIGCLDLSHKPDEFETQPRKPPRF